MSEIGVNVDYADGLEAYSSFPLERSIDPRDAKISDITTRSIRKIPTGSTKALTGFHPVPGDPRFGELATNRGVRTVFSANDPLRPLKIPFLTDSNLADSNNDSGIAAQINHLSNEILHLKTEEADLRRTGFTIQILCTVIGFCFYGAGVIPGILIGWAIREFVYNRSADRLADKIHLKESDRLRLYLILQEQNKETFPRREVRFPQSKFC